MASILTGKSGKTIAIEPDPDNLKILKRSLELNNLDNTIVVDKALYSKSGERMNLYQNGVMSNLFRAGNNESNTFITVETITFAEVVSGLSLQPKLLKMEIEGTDEFALLSSHNTFKTINYFEGEIHSLEDYNILLRYSDLFPL